MTRLHLRKSVVGSKQQLSGEQNQKQKQKQKRSLELVEFPIGLLALRPIFAGLHRPKLRARSRLA